MLPSLLSVYYPHRQAVGLLVGIVLAVLNGLLNFLWLPISPIWAVVLMAIDVLIIWALASTRSDLRA